MRRKFETDGGASNPPPYSAFASGAGARGTQHAARPLGVYTPPKSGEKSEAAGASDALRGTRSSAADEPRGIDNSAADELLGKGDVRHGEGGVGRSGDAAQRLTMLESLASSVDVDPDSISLVRTRTLLHPANNTHAGAVLRNAQA